MNSLSDLFWVDGDDDKKAKTPAQVQSVAITAGSDHIATSSLTEAFSGKASMVMQCFTDQVALFQSSITDINQLLNIVMISVKQHHPNVTEGDLITAFTSSKDVLKNLASNRIRNNAKLIDGRAAEVKNNHTSVLADIVSCTEQLRVLEKQQRKYEQTLSDHQATKDQFVIDIQSESAGILTAVDNQISLLKKGTNT